MKIRLYETKKIEDEFSQLLFNSNNEDLQEKARNIILKYIPDAVIDFVFQNNALKVTALTTRQILEFWIAPVEEYRGLRLVT